MTLQHSFKRVFHPSSHNTKVLDRDTTTFHQEYVSSIFTRYRSHEWYYQPGLFNACGSYEALQSVMDLGFQCTPPPSVLVSAHCMSCSYSHYVHILFNLMSLFFPCSSSFPCFFHSGSHCFFWHSCCMHPFIMSSPSSSK